MVVNGKTATAFGIVLGLALAGLLAAGQAGFAGARSSIRHKPAASSQDGRSVELPPVRVKAPVAPSRYSAPRRALRVSSSRQTAGRAERRPPGDDRARARKLRQRSREGRDRPRHKRRPARRRASRTQVLGVGPGEDLSGRDRSRLGIGAACGGARQLARRERGRRRRSRRQAAGRLRRPASRGELVSKLRRRRRPEPERLSRPLRIRPDRSQRLPGRPPRPGLVGRHRRGVPVARRHRPRATCERPALRGQRDLDGHREQRLRARGRLHRSDAGRDLHRALHNWHRLPKAARRAERRRGGQRGVGKRRRRQQAGERRERDRGRLLRHDGGRRLSRPRHDENLGPALQVRRSERAAIGDYRGDGNRFYDNDFGGIAGGAVPISCEYGGGR
jgi:hypothetical protein